VRERFDTFGPPAAERDPWETATPEPVDDGGELDPRDAAALLGRTAQQAEREFDLRPPLLTLAAAVTVLVAYGAVWLSVRNQHPYSGPTGTALAVLYGTLAVWIVLVATVTHRALSGRSSKQRRLEGVVFAAIWICVYVFQGALYHAGASKGIVYGIWPAVAPLIVVGAAAAAYETARQNRTTAGFALAAVLLGTFASFAGPAGVWGVMGVGLCSLLLLGAAAQLWQRRA
jgi:cytochrome bd-type quinol oxidase subunit 2